jgi:hypothetical protein
MQSGLPGFPQFAQTLGSDLAGFDSGSGGLRADHCGAAALSRDYPYSICRRWRILPRRSPPCLYRLKLAGAAGDRATRRSRPTMRAGFRDASRTAVPSGAPVNSCRFSTALSIVSTLPARAPSERQTPSFNSSSHPAFLSRTFHPSPGWPARRPSSSAIAGRSPDAHAPRHRSPLHKHRLGQESFR